MIHSSDIEGHHFMRARRRGYDPAEVDAVIGRLVDALRTYEEREQAAAVTDLDSVRAARGDLLDDAEAVGHQLELQARTKLDEAERVAAERLAEAEEQAEHLVEVARADAARLLSRRNARAEALITAALSEVKGLRGRVIHETNEFRAGKRTEAEALVRTAELQASQLIEDARHEAGSILGRARREHMMLERRIGQLRSAIAGIEGQFRHLAETTLEQTEIVSSMISLETHDLEDVLEEAPEHPIVSDQDVIDGDAPEGTIPERVDDEPEVVRLTQGGLAVDLTGSSEDTEPPNHQGDDRYAVQPGDTLYQRRIGLRRRLEDEVEDSPE